MDLILRSSLWCDWQYWNSCPEQAQLCRPWRVCPEETHLYWREWSHVKKEKHHMEWWRRDSENTTGTHSSIWNQRPSLVLTERLCRTGPSSSGHRPSWWHTARGLAFHCQQRSVLEAVSFLEVSGFQSWDRKNTRLALQDKKNNKNKKNQPFVAVAW